MSKPSKLAGWQFHPMSSLLFVVIYLIAFKLTNLLPEEYHSYYALFASIIFLIDVLILFLPDKEFLEERKGYLLFLALGLTLLLISALLIYTNTQPGIWISSFSIAASFLTSMVIFKYFRKLVIIP